MKLPFVGADRHSWVLFVPGELTKRLLVPLTSPQNPIVAFFSIKCTVLKELAEILALQSAFWGGVNTLSIPCRDLLSSPCSDAEHPLGCLWGVKRRSPSPVLCPAQWLPESFSLQVTCELCSAHQLRVRPFPKAAGTMGASEGPAGAVAMSWEYSLTQLSGSIWIPQMWNFGASGGQSQLGEGMARKERLLQKLQTPAQAVLPSMQAASVKLRDKEGIRR